MSRKKGITRVNLGSLGCLVLLLALLAAQFMPFWTYGEAGETASIAQYVWQPEHHKGMTTYMKAALGEDFTLNSMVLWPIVTLVSAAVGAVLCVVKQRHVMTPAVCMLAGLAACIACLAEPALRLGVNWWLQLLLGAAVLALGAFTLRWSLLERKQA